MTHIVDKRFTQKDGSVANRQKFLKRYRESIKKAVRGIIGKETIKDFSFRNKKIKISSDSDTSIDLPDIRNDSNNGVYDSISVGNKKYRKGDRQLKPEEGKSGGSGNSSNGETDEFEFTLTEDEFADFFFEDLELPDLIKKQFTGDAYVIERAGYSNTGGPSSLCIKQTIIRAFMRRYALQKSKDKHEKARDCDSEINPEGLNILSKRRKIHFLEEIDLRYNYRDRVDLPTTKAVMFCLLDVSGSMGETEKDIAKRFFLLLKLFLEYNYEKVEIVFIRHADWAEECDEEKFFYGRESGGTIVSTGYECIHSIIKERYDVNTCNIYIAQASDGDNFDSDNPILEEILVNDLLPLTQYFAFIEINNPDYRWRDSDLLKVINNISKRCNNLQARVIQKYSDIYEVFRSLFKKVNK